MSMVIIVMVNFYLESSAINQATNGEIPSDIVAGRQDRNLGTAVPLTRHSRGGGNSLIVISI